MSTVGQRERLTQQQALRFLVDEQDATILSGMDSEIEALERHRDKSRRIKQGMMQQLLTGRVRLVEPGDYA